MAMPNTRNLFLASVGCTGFLLTFYPTVFSGFERMQPDAGDVVLNNYFLEHTYRWAFDRNYACSFWSPSFFTPTPDTFTYSETLIGTAPLYWLLRTGFSEPVSCQLWIMITYGLNFMALATVLRWFGVNTVLTAAGAFVFAFGLIRTDHLAHQQLMPQYFSPFAVWYAWGFLREPSARRWGLLIGLAAIQVFASLHLGWFLGLGLMVFVGIGFVAEAGSFRRVRAFVRAHPLSIVMPLLIAGLLLGMYARNFYRGAPSTRSYWEAEAYTPSPDGWFVSPPGSIWADHLTPRGVEEFPEKMLFPGFTLYGAFLVAGWLAWRRPFPERRLVLACLGTSAILMLLVTRWGHNFSLWYFVHQLVPGANAFRAVGRLVFAIHLFGTIGGLLGLQEFLRQNVSVPTRRGVIYALVALLIVIEQVRVEPESFDKRKLMYGPARELAMHMNGADAAYVVYDASMPDYRHQITAMWAGMWARTPVMNGFSGTQPKGYPALEERPTLEDLVRLLGREWRGKLAIIEWGPPIRRRVYNVRDGQATPVSD